MKIYKYEAYGSRLESAQDFRSTNKEITATFVHFMENTI